MRTNDKAGTLKAASTLGIEVPAQYLVNSSADAPAAAAWIRAYPIVLKPARALSAVSGRLVKLPTQYAYTPEELRRKVGALPAEVFPVLAQQRIIGPGVGVFLLRWDAEIVAVFCHRRIREKPPSGGVSVCSESIPPEPILVERSRVLLERLDWQGVAMVEYKLDAVSTKPFLMEVNGRFWGSLQLAVDAGVDFPMLLVACASGQRPNPVTTYRVGVRTRWWWGDADHLMARIFHSPNRLCMPPGAPSRLRVAWDVLVPHPRQRNEVFRLDDPKPFLRETVNWIRGR